MRRRHFVTGLAGITAGLGWGAVPESAVAQGRGAPGPNGDRTAVPTPRGRRTAQGWQEVAVPPGVSAARLLKVAAAGPDRAWAVGEQGRDGTAPGQPLALHWDGTAWSHTDLEHLALVGALTGVAAPPTAPTAPPATPPTPPAAWAIGGDTGAGCDRLLRWDGTTWQDCPFPGRAEAGTRLSALTVAADGDVWAAGVRDGRARLLRRSDSRWRWLPPLPDSPTDPTDPDSPVGPPALWNVRTAPDGSVWVSGDAIARWHQGGWTVLPSPGGIRLTVTDLLPVAPDEVWAVGAAFGPGGPPDKPPGVVLLRWDGTEWVSERDSLPFGVGALFSVVADADGRPALLSGWDFWDGARTHYLRRGADGWVSERGPLAEGLTPMMTHLAPVPGTDEVWAVGTTTRYATRPPARFRVERFGGAGATPP
ncbi:hypothetical protein [Streptomyces sp. NPDC054784]